MADIGSSLLAFAATPLGKKVSNTIFSKSVSFSASFITSFKKKNEENKLIKRYLEACEGVKKFRTIGFSSQDVSFDDIYVPLNVTSSTNTNYLVTNSLELKHTRPINIVGRAGQGKSTILRRLFLNMVTSGTQLPFFFELKYFKEDSLEKNLINEFKKWGFTFDEDTVLEFISRKDVTLFLDAFDEVPTDRINDVLEQITRVKNTSMCDLIITSRPNTRICFVENIDTFNVVDLTQNQVFEILKVICSSSKQFNSLKLAITDKKHVLEAIISPILVVLLQIVYSHSNAVPHTLNDFYNRVFLTLFHRHDELKTNVERGFKTDLNCGQSEKVFQAFCYLSLKNNDLEFTEETALQHMEDALALRGFREVKAADYFYDIFHVTNIIQEDGYDNYSFFHRSLQEFYAYKFIKGYFTPERQIKFFTRCQHDATLSNAFTLVLSFFDDDPEATYYLESYFLPLFGEILGADIDFDYRAAGERLIRHCVCSIHSSPISANQSNERIIDGIGFQYLPAALRKIIDIDFLTARKTKRSPFKTIMASIHGAILRTPDHKQRLFHEIAELSGGEVLETTHVLPEVTSLPGHILYEQLMTDKQRREFLDSYCSLIDRAGLLEIYKKRLKHFNDLKQSADRILFDGL